MHPALHRNTYLVKEHVGPFKVANNYDVYDPETNELVLHCREDRMGMLTQWFRLTDYKQMTPFDIEIRTPSGEVVVQVKRGISFFLSKVNVFDGANQPIGSFAQKLMSIGGAFTVLDPAGEEVCQLKGKWTSWEFRFLAGDQELAKVSKKWSGFGKELFTSADNYMLQISDAVPPDSHIRALVMASVMCVDMVLKED